MFFSWENHPWSTPPNPKSVPFSLQKFHRHAMLDGSGPNFGWWKISITAGEKSPFALWKKWHLNQNHVKWHRIFSMVHSSFCMVKTVVKRPLFFTPIRSSPILSPWRTAQADGQRSDFFGAVPEKIMSQLAMAQYIYIYHFII